VFLILILFVYFLFTFVFHPRVGGSEVKILKCFYFLLINIIYGLLNTTEIQNRLFKTLFYLENIWVLFSVFISVFLYILFCYNVCCFLYLFLFLYILLCYFALCLLPIYFRFSPTCWGIWSENSKMFLFFVYQYYIWIIKYNRDTK
jgi:hypothetical protein